MQTSSNRRPPARSLPRWVTDSRVPVPESIVAPQYLRMDCVLALAAAVVRRSPADPHYAALRAELQAELTQLGYMALPQ